jgi:hypothetical protein
MFLPLEPLLASALEEDASLLDQAASLRVIPATPLTLLRAAQSGRARLAPATAREERRGDSEIGRELYERLGTMVGHLEAVAENLKGAGDAYDASWDRSTESTAGRAALQGTGRSLARRTRRARAGPPRAAFRDAAGTDGAAAGRCDASEPAPPVDIKTRR